MTHHSWAVAAAALLTAASAFSATASINGPLRAQVDGFDPTEKKVFYHLYDYSEAGEDPQVWYFDLNSAHPTQALRARSLEAPPSQANSAFANVSRRLQRLRGEAKFELKLAVDADSVGADSAWNSPVYDLHVHLEAGSKVRDVRLQAYCDPLVRVQGLYQIPGRNEEIVVISRIGRLRDCDEVELPVLLPAKDR